MPPAEDPIHARDGALHVAPDDHAVREGGAVPVPLDRRGPEWLRVALAQLTEGVIVADGDGRIGYVNEAAVRLHGVARLDVAPGEYAEAYQLLTEDGAPYPSTELPLARAVLRGETVEEARWRIRRPDGTEVLAVGSARPLLDPEGVRIGAVLTLRDDTARQEALGREAASRARLREETARHVEQLQAHAVELAVANETLQEQAAELEAANQHLQETQLELEVQTDALAHANVALEAAARHAAAERDAADASRSRVEAVLESTSDAFVALDREWRVVYMNGVAERLHGSTREAVLGRSHWEVWPNSVGAPLEHAYRRAMAERVSVRLEHHYAEPPAYDNWFEVAAYPWEDGLAIFYRDITERKRTALALADREARWRTLAEAMPHLVWTCRADGWSDFSNQRWLDYTGQRQEETWGLGWMDAMHPDDRRPTLDAWEPAVARGEPFETYYRLRRASDGAYRWFLARAVPQRDGAGDVARWFGSCTDVHDARTAAEENARLVAALRASREELAGLAERFGLAQDAAGIGVFDWHVPSGRVTWTEEEERLFGLAPGTFEGTFEGWAHRVLPEDASRMEREIAGAIARREPGLAFGFRLRRPDGAVRWIEGKAAFAYAADGSALRMVGVNIDVTERHEAEARLRASEARLASVFQQAPVAVAVTHGREAAEMVFELANPHYLELVPPGQPVLGRRVREVFPDAGEVVLGALQRVLDTGEAFAATEFLVRIDRDGDGAPEDYWFNLVYHPLVDVDGRVAGLVTVAGEVTAQVRARRAAEDANATKSQFLATMSHELRTPLNAIQGHVQLLELELHGPVTPQQRDAFGRIERAQRHLLGLINDVLSYARLEGGRVEYDVADVAAADAVRDVVPMVEPQLLAKGLRFEARLPADADAPRVRADREKLAQILLNLLSNAVKFTPGGGAVRLELDASAEGVVRLSVVDTGIGIPPDKLEAVFEPFVQVRSAYAAGPGGTGLGLAISRDLARGMGGDLTAASAPGVGSTFTLTLPRA